MDTFISDPSTDTSSITPRELLARLAGADAPLVLDVRRDARFNSSDRMIAGALRCAPEQLDAWIAAHDPQDIVVYCVYGHEVGQAAAQSLRAAGWTARYLQGGIEGGEDGVDDPAWRAVRLPMQNKPTGAAA
jgi:rhodanese-related sulfurtransferase